MTEQIVLPLIRVLDPYRCMKRRLVKPSDTISVSEGLIKDSDVENAIKEQFLLETQCACFGLAIESVTYGKSISDLDITSISYIGDGHNSFAFMFEIKSINFKFPKAYTSETIDRIVNDRRSIRLEVMNRSLTTVDGAMDLLITQMGQYDELKEKIKKMIEKEEDV